MTTHETPCYYRVGPRQSDSPAIEDCVEGRLRLTEEGLVLGTDATSSDGSHTDRIDKHSNSAIRRLFGGHFDPQLFSFDDLPTDRTIAVPLTSIQDVQFLTWDGSHLRGADQTHGILVQTTAFGGDALLIQLGHGDRNRGSGTKRHRLFAQTLDALLAQSSPDRSAAGNGSVAAGTETVDASENSQVDWLDAPTAETTLVARNTSDETVTAHIGYREDEVVGGTYDVELDGNSTRSGTDSPLTTPSKSVPHWARGERLRGDSRWTASRLPTSWSRSHRKRLPFSPEMARQSNQHQHRTSAHSKRVRRPSPAPQLKRHPNHRPGLRQQRIPVALPARRQSTLTRLLPPRRRTRPKGAY
ncbi:hypothetical protein ACFQH8_14430 [Halomicroarcula sp. GCM10025710]